MKRLPLEPRAAGALVGVVASFLLFLTLLSYGEAEFASGEPLLWYQTIGALFIDPLGLGAFVLALSPLVWSLVVYFREELPDVVTRGVGTLLFAVSVALVVGILQGGQESFWAGHLGTAAAAWFESVGLWKILFWVGSVVLFVVSLMLATDFLFYNVRNPAAYEPAAQLVTVETEPEFESLDENGDVATTEPRRHVVERREVASLDVRSEDEAPAAITTPEGWSKRAEGDREVLRGPVGYDGVEFLSSDEELASPAAPMSEEVLYRAEFDDDQREYRAVETVETDSVAESVPTDEATDAAVEAVAPAAEVVVETDAEPGPEPSEDHRTDDDELLTEDEPGGIGYPEGGLVQEEVVAFSPALYGVVGFDDPELEQTDDSVAARRPAQAADESGPEPVQETVAEQADAPERTAEEPQVSASAPTPTDDAVLRRAGSFDDVVVTDLPLFDDVVIGGAVAEARQEETPSPARQTSRVGLAARMGELELDPLFHDAVDAVLTRGRASAVVLQRELGIGYARGLRILDQMTSCGVAGEDTPTGARELRVTTEEWTAALGTGAPSS